MPLLSVIVPTRNERDNIPALIDLLRRTLAGVDYEVIIVDDDSPDNTAAVARTIAQTDPRIRVLHRIHRRGLSSAVVEGMLSASSDYLAVMDADLQHDESILPAMLQKLQSGQYDVVLASRNVAGGGMGSFAKHRQILSDAGRRLSAALIGARVSDPMSGYFMVTSEYFQTVARKLSCIGFKILLDILASSTRPVRVCEIPYVFGERLYGESKLDVVVGLEYMQLIFDKLTRGYLPTTFLTFALVGLCGAILNLMVSALLSRFLDFGVALGLGATAAMVVNFVFNNGFTFRAQRLRGRRFLHGLLLFCATCSLGLGLQVVVARSLVARGLAWYVATCIGIVAGSVWNYTMAYVFVWQIKRRRASVPITWRESQRQPAEAEAMEHHG
jgi:dolichol-phosphate mannosyltransferase